MYNYLLGISAAAGVPDTTMETDIQKIVTAARVAATLAKSWIQLVWSILPGTSAATLSIALPTMDAKIALTKQAIDTAIQAATELALISPGALAEAANIAAIVFKGLYAQVTRIEDIADGWRRNGFPGGLIRQVVIYPLIEAVKLAVDAAALVERPAFTTELSIFNEQELTNLLYEFYRTHG